MKNYLTEVLTCISLMNDDDKYLFMCYWPFVYLLVEKCLFKCFSPFFELLLSCSSYILEIKCLSDMIFKYFLPFYKLSFHFPDNGLWYTDVFNFDEIQLIYFNTFADCPFGV